MKTIKEWLGQLPKDIAEKAIRNTAPQRMEYEEPSRKWALYGAFHWSKSPEGHEFWENIAKGIESKNQ